MRLRDCYCVPQSYSNVKKSAEILRLGVFDEIVSFRESIIKDDLFALL